MVSKEDLEGYFNKESSIDSLRETLSRESEGDLKAVGGLQKGLRGGFVFFLFIRIG